MHEKITWMSGIIYCWTKKQTHPHQQHNNANERHDRNKQMPTPTKEQRYKAILISLFSHKDEIQYAKDHEFTEAELTALVPGDICRFMKWKAYGNPDANIEMDNPTEGRSSALEFYKKAISFFIPMRNATWNPTMSCGNPTRSVQVNELIKKVKKKEVRRQGAPSQARREMEEAEFLQTNELLNGEQAIRKGGSE